MDFSTTTARAEAVKADAIAVGVHADGELTGIVQVPVAKVSFEAKKLHDNANAILESVIKARPASVKGRYLRSATLSSTMGPGVKLDPVAIAKQSEA